MKSLKNFGRDNKDVKFQINDGNNYKMSEFQGLMGYLDLKRVKKRILRRKKLAKIYQEFLKKNKIFNCSYQKKGVTSYYKQIITTRINNSILREYFNKYNSKSFCYNSDTKKKMNYARNLPNQWGGQQKEEIL